MAKVNFTNKKKQEEEKKLPVDIVPEGMTLEVDGVKDWESGVFFNLTVGNIFKIYGCKVARTKKGEYFISMPSRKGTDKRYYAHCIVRLSESQTEEVLGMVSDALNNAEGE